MGGILGSGFSHISTGGENYGWRCYEGIRLQHQLPGTMMLSGQYSHSLGCSVTGGYVYRQ
jgi:hypothetical protein